MPLLSRRQLAAMLGAAGGSLMLPRRSRAAVRPEELRFLFVFNDGGWDQHSALVPVFDAPDIPTEEGSALAEQDGLAWVSHPNRPSVDEFFTRYSSTTALFHGFEVRSVAHERCRQLVMTGSADAGADDWPAILAGMSSEDLTLPCLVASGPSFSARFNSQVIRLGETGQLSGLLDGSAISPQLPASPDAEDLIEAHLQQRAAALSGGLRADFGARYAGALTQLADVAALNKSVNFSADSSKQLIDKLQPVLDCLELGLSRCAMINNFGFNDTGFDTHANCQLTQSEHFEQLFGDLLTLMDELSSRTTPSGRLLSEEVVVVVLSEMGRTPQLNNNLGRDHWTWTSAMLLGPGIRPGMIGGYDTNDIGRPIDPTTGQPSDGGLLMTSAHLGATLLTMGGVDPAEFLPGIDPITGLLA